ncbi:MAG: GHMP kinase [Calditrichaeota bacterium]|nr:MAG: GHMP kinase [Calditrichota bacterium]
MDKPLQVSAPGRICLFGEHQDYLGLPVITSAINLRVRISGEMGSDDKVRLDLPDIKEYTSFALTYPLRYSEPRDYFKSVLNILSREGVVLSKGVDIVVRGNIPINSGTSSSSALVVAWTAFLLKLANDARAHNPEAIARLAHRAEVVEFHEPGGQMDHFASAFGGALFIEFETGKKPQPLDVPLGAFVLGDSREPKDTTSILARVKGGSLEAIKQAGKSIHEISLNDLENVKSKISAEQYRLLHAQLMNRQLTRVAYTLMNSAPFDHHQFGNLIFKHYEQLRDGLNISTPKIDRMINAAMEAGALGAKINGSGGGGCMFAYAPEKSRQVAEAIVRAGGKAYIIHTDKGVYFDDSSE